MAKTRPAARTKSKVAGRPRKASKAKAPAGTARTRSRDDDGIPADVLREMDKSVDRYIERWRRGLLLVIDGKVQRLSDVISSRSAPRPKSKPKKKTSKRLTRAREPGAPGRRPAKRRRMT